MAFHEESASRLSANFSTRGLHRRPYTPYTSRDFLLRNFHVAFVEHGTMEPLHLIISITEILGTDLLGTWTPRECQCKLAVSPFKLIQKRQDVLNTAI